MKIYGIIELVFYDDLNEFRELRKTHNLCVCVLGFKEAKAFCLW